MSLLKGDAKTVGESFVTLNVQFDYPTASESKTDILGGVKDLKFQETGGLTPKHGRSHIRIFTPAKLNKLKFNRKVDDKKLEELVVNSLPSKVGQRMYRVFIIFIGVFGCILLLIGSEDNFHVTKVVAIQLIGMFISYFLHIYFLIGYSTTAYRIYSLNCVVPNWSTMPITARQLVHRYKPIKSISEYSAIGGGVANQMLVVISSSAWMVVLTQFLNIIWIEKIFRWFTDMVNCNSCDKKYVHLMQGIEHADNVFMFIGTFGLVMIGIFELDPYSKILQTGHMTGVFLGFGCPIGFTIQATYAVIRDGFNKHLFNMIMAIVCDVVAIVFGILWVYVFNKKSDKLAEELKNYVALTKEDETKTQQRIRRLSVANIFSESVTLLAGSLSLCLWLWNYNDIHQTYDGKQQYGFLPNEGPWVTYYNYLSETYNCDNKIIPEYQNELPTLVCSF